MGAREELTASIPNLMGRVSILIFPSYDRLVKRFPPLAISLRTGLLVLIFILLEKFLFNFLKLSVEGYSEPSLSLSAIEKIGPAGLLLILLVSGTLARYGKLLAPWSALDMGAQIRALVVFLAVVVAWPLSTYGYNYYYDQGYYYDRLILLLLLVLVWYRPAFIFLFLMLAFVSLWQLDVPHLNNSSHIAHKVQLLHVLCMFAAVFLVYSVTGRGRTDDFLFLTCCLVAAVYWMPALTKLKLNWIFHGQLYHMPLAAYAHGWLANVQPDAMINFARSIAWFDWPMRLFVMAMEVGCLLFLLRRRLSVILLVAAIGFHLGVFVLYGYLFWTWIALDGALLIILLRDRQQKQIGIYSTSHFLVSVLLIGFAAHWCFPSKLAWYDTRLSYTFRYKAIGVSGESYDVAPRFFEPYGDVFTMATFNYLVADHRALASPYATTTSKYAAFGLMKSTTAEQVFLLESEVGGETYDAARAARYAEFLGRYLEHRNNGEMAPAFLRFFRSPPQFWSFGRGHVYSGQEPIREIEVIEITTLFDDQSLREIRELTVLKLPIKVAVE